MNVYITGGAGFIGSNVADFYVGKKANVTIFDNFSRQGSKQNIELLKKRAPRLKIFSGHIRSQADLLKTKKELAQADLIIHLAAQVAVTTSVQNPVEDFEINAYGTLNLLELARQVKSKAKIIYSSTNKVYGGMENVAVKELKLKYLYKNLPYGISEAQPLDFHSPYGCSKGAADQYFHDYSRIYGLDTVVFRQSCIYGPRQFGVEDQGWVAWFIIALLTNRDLTVYGDGKQTRDLLYVDDLVKAYDKAFQAGDVTKGKIYNVGGGNANTMSVWSEFGPKLQKLFNRKMSVMFREWRPGDQKVFISDIRKAKTEFDWQPTVSVDEGINQLYSWASNHKDIFH